MATAMRPDHQGLPGYDRGYADGRKACNEALTAYCEEIGYKPSILRNSDFPITPVDPNDPRNPGG